MERPITPEERNYWAFKLPVQAPPPAAANKYLVNPKEMVPGTTMTFVGIKNDTQRADVIAYLATLK